MSPYTDSEWKARRLSRRAKWITWATLVSMTLVALVVVAIVQQNARAKDLLQASERDRVERFNNTLSSCEEQNQRNIAAKQQLRTFLLSITPTRPQTPEERRRALEVLDGFTNTLSDAFVPPRVDKKGNSTCLAYAKSRVSLNG